MDALDLDQDFLTKFSCMGTQDKDVLIAELQSILELSRADCLFFLEMSNWYAYNPKTSQTATLLFHRNLQAAVGAYCDFCGNNVTLPQMRVIDETPVCVIPANSNFTKSWRLKNSGTSCDTVLRIYKTHRTRNPPWFHCVLYMQVMSIGHWVWCAWLSSLGVCSVLPRPFLSPHWDQVNREPYLLTYKLLLWPVDIRLNGEWLVTRQSVEVCVSVGGESREWYDYCI